jgi:hypothetical protein
MKQLLFFGFTLFLSSTLFSQTIKKQLIANAGTSFSNSNSTIYWSIGETMTKSYSNELLIFEGFHLPKEESITSTSKHLNSQAAAVLFPNPNSGQFTLRLNQVNYPMEYTLYSVHGQVVKNGILSNEKYDFDISKFPQGVYHLKIQNSNYNTSISFIKL